MDHWICVCVWCMHMCLLIKSKGQHLISSSATLPLILERVYHRAQSSVIWLNCWPASLRDPPVSSSQGYDYRFIVSFPVFFTLLLEIWTQVLMITRHALYQLLHLPSRLPFFIIYCVRLIERDISPISPCQLVPVFLFYPMKLCFISGVWFYLRFL